MRPRILRLAHRLAPADAMGLRLFVRQALPEGPRRGSVVLVHGATLASGLWDIDVPGYSVLLALARMFRVQGAQGWLMALGLAQAGEFGFVLIAFALANGVLPADITPRGRWYLKLRPITLTPLASSAEARVSPA